MLGHYLAVHTVTCKCLFRVSNTEIKFLHKIFESDSLLRAVKWCKSMQPYWTNGPVSLVFLARAKSLQQQLLLLV